MLIGPSNTSRQITVETSGADTELRAYTSCPDSSAGSSRIAYNDNGGPGLGSKITFTAASWASYYVVLEPDYSSSCGNTSITFEATVLPDRGSCGSPIYVDPPASLVLNPCDLWDSTASSSSDAVMLISASDTSRQLAVITSGTDTEVYVFTQCPDSVGGSSQVANNDDGGPNWGSKVVFTAAASTSYYVVLEPHNSYDCGDARVEVLGPPPAGLGTCSDPLPVEPPASFALNPCDYVDSTASSDDDAVMLIGPSSTPRVMTVETLGADTRLFSYTLCPDSEHGTSKVTSNDNGGPDLGSKIAFVAQANVSYFVVLEPDYAYSDCGTAGVIFNSTELPWQRGSCTDPIPVEPPSTLTQVFPCAYGNSTASSSKDAVMLISPSDALRVITVETFTSDAALYIYSSCPEEEHGATQVAYDKLDGSGSGSKISFAARASESYYIAMEDSSDDCSVSSVAFNVTETLDASELPRQEGTCSFPIRVDPPASFVLDICAYSHSTASSKKDAVMFIGPSNSTRRITVEASGLDTELYAFSFCPETSAGSIQVAYDDDGGSGTGSMMTFTAERSRPYYIVLEPYYSYACSNASVAFDVTELPGHGSCDAPLHLDPPASLVLNPCDLWDSTASSSSDAVMLISAADMERELTVITSGTDTEVYIFTQCPDSADGSSQIAYDDDGGPNTGSKVVFTAAPSTQYYVVLEPYSSSSCGDASVDVLLNPSQGSGSCSNPFPVDPPAAFALNPCDYGDSTASSDGDAVMLIGPSSTPRIITVETLGADTRLYAFTSCPDIEDGASQVAQNDAGGAGSGSKILIHAQANVSFFIVVELDSPDCKTAGAYFDAFELPWQSASCSAPIPVEPPATLTQVYPCAYDNSTASSSRDVVMLISPSDSARQITVISSQIDTQLYVFTQCPDSEDGSSQVAHNDDGGPGTGSRVTFFAESQKGYYAVLEPYSSSVCGNASVTFEATELPEQGSEEASCSSPIRLSLDPSTSLSLSPCMYEQSAASPEKDAVMLISPSDSPREVTVVSTQMDTELYVYTHCPDSEGGPSQVAYDDDSGPDTGSKVVFTAEPLTSYYVILEPYSPSECGNASVDVTEVPASVPPPLQDACEDPQSVNLDQYGDFYTASFDSCTGNVAKLAPFSSQRTIRVAVTPEQDGVSSDFFVSEFCLQAQDGRSTVDITQNSDGNQFVAASDKAYFVALGGDSSTCGPVKLYIEFLNVLLLGSQRQAGCGSISPLALNDTGTIFINNINFCDQEDSSGGTLANYDLGRRRDFVIALAPSPVSSRQIQVTVNDLPSGTRPILLASKKCSGHTQDDVLAWFDPSGDSSDSVDITFTASAGVQLYIVLESPDADQCGPQGQVQISCLSADPSLPALGRTGIRRIGMELRIDTNFNELTRTSEQIKAFKKDVSNSLARGLHTLQPELLELEDSPQDICLSCVRVGDLAQGSVIAPITILLRDDEQKGKIKEFARQINDVDTRSLIEDSSYSDQAIAHSVSVEPADSDEVSPPPSSKQPNPPPSSKQPNPPPSSKQPNQPNDGSSGDNGGDGSSNASVIGPAVGVPVGVVFLLVLLVPLIYWACKHRRMEPGLMPGPAPELSSFRHEPVPTGPPPLSPRPGPSGPPRPAAPPPPRPPPSPPRAAAPPPPRPPPSPPRAAAPPPPRPPPSLPRSSAELSPQAFPPWPPSAPSPPPRPSPGAPTHPAPPTAPSWPEFAEPAPRPPQPEMPPASTFQPASLADLPPIYYPHRIDNPLHVGTPAIDPTEPIAPPIVPPDSARPGPRSPPGLVDNPIGEEEILPLYEPSPLPEIQQNQPLPGEECLVCLDGPRQYGFLHSGTLHLGVCQECASHIRRGSACMVCRGTIEHIIRVHS